MDDHPSALQPVSPRRMSAEALIGLGITFAALGVLFLFLGWAEHLRSVNEAMAILLGIGGVMFVLGLIICMMGKGRRA